MNINNFSENMGLSEKINNLSTKLNNINNIIESINIDTLKKILNNVNKEEEHLKYHSNPEKIEKRDHDINNYRNLLQQQNHMYDLINSKKILPNYIEPFYQNNLNKIFNIDISIILLIIAIFIIIYYLIKKSNNFSH